MKANSYRVTWISDQEEQEQITEVTALSPRYAAITVREIEEIMNNQLNVIVTGVEPN